jgi:FkbM family methyltransferase
MRELLGRLVRGTPAEPLARALRRRFPAKPSPDHAYDEQLVSVMTRVLAADSSCIDAGAHAGKFVRHMIDLAPRGRHVAFEPLPMYAARLRAGFPGVDVREQALADSAGTRAFRVVPGEAVQCSGFQRRPWDTYAEDGVELIDVEVVRLDDVVDHSIRLLKVDVEGAELELFRGGREVLSRERPFVPFENSSDPAQIYGVLVEDAGLQLSLMNDWLAGRQPLSRDKFVDEALSTRNYFFLAHP